MSVRIHYDEPSEYVRPKLEDLDIQTVDYTAIVGVPDVRRDTTPTGSEEKKPGNGYSWLAWGFNIDLGGIEELSDFVVKFLEVVDKTNKIVMALLKLMRIFSSDFKSISRLLKVLLKIVLKRVKELIDGFTSTGVYVTTIFPNIDSRSPKFAIPINGGYKEFVATVNARCNDRRSESSPRFGKGDAVGGMVLAMIGAQSDPQFLADLIQNLYVLGNLFRFRPPTPSPAKNVTAVPGFYKVPKKDRTASSNEPELKMGVKISWEHPGTPLSGFIVRRSLYEEGTKEMIKGPDGKMYPGYKYVDPVFDKNMQEEKVVIGKPNYEYIDFDVEPDKLYFYKVYTTVGYNFFKKYPFFEKVESPLASKTVHAVPRKKIPLSELVEASMFDQNAVRVKRSELKGPWQSFTLRRLLGPEIDALLGRLDELIDKFTGLVSTAGDSMTEYLKFAEKKIKFYLDLMNEIADLIVRLLQLRLSGTFLLLNIDPEQGGMQNFLRKFNGAVLTEEIASFQVGANGKPMTLGSLMDRGIMAGVVLVYGYPQLDGNYVGTLVSKEELGQFEKQLESSKKAMEAFTKLLGLGG